MKKLLITLILIITTFIWNNTFSFNSDCEYIKDYDWEEKLPDSIKNMFDDSLGKELLTEKWMIRAIKNLKKYCCFNTEQLKWDKNCEQSKYEAIQDDYPKSPYLFDHILSVMVRRLWSSWHNYVWVDMDKKAEEWFNFVAKYAKKKEWANPKEFQAKYKEYRFNDKSREKSEDWKLDTKTPKYKISLYDGTSEWEYINVIEVWNIKSTIKDPDKFKKLDEWDLTTKHLNVCQTAIYLTMKQGRFDSKDESNLRIQNNCLKKIYELDSKYTEYFSKVMTTQSNLLAQNTTSKFKQNIDNRNSIVTSNIWQTNNYRWWVMRMIQQITPKCN